MADSKITALTGYTAPISTDVLPIVDVTAGITKKVTVANLTSTKQDKLNVTAVKSANYSSSASDYVPCDISAGGFAVTLPSAPLEGTVIETKITKVDTTTVLEIKCSGTDVFNRVGGETSIYLNLLSTVGVFTYQASTGIWYADISTPGSAFAMQFPGIDAQTPLTYSDITINTTTRVLTVTPPLGYFYINIDGNGKNTRIRKTGTINFTAFTNTTGMWYFYFNSTGVATTTQTPWTVNDFSTAVPLYRIYWNATLYNFTITAGNASEGATYTNNTQTFTVRQTIAGATTLMTSGTGDPQASGTLTLATGTGNATLTFSAYSVAPRLVSQYLETHLNTISADAHQWFHLQGSVWEEGFTMANNALTSGAPNVDGRNTVVALSSGTNMDDNLDYTVTNDATPTLPFEQDLGNTTPASLNATNSSLFEVFRYQTTGLTYRTATRFPFDWSITTNIPNYITALGVRTPVTNQRFMVNFIYATQNPSVGQAVRVVSATTDFTSITNARAYTWQDIQNTYPLLNDGEVRPMYRLIHEMHSSTPNVYTSAEKFSVLRETQDLRKAAVTSTTAATGSLPASSVTFAPTVTVGSTNVQSAIEELDAEKLPLSRVAVSTALMTEAATGFTIEGGTTKKTLTVALDANVAGTNTGDQTITLSGDVTGTGTGAITTTIAAKAVTLAKMNDLAQNTIIGRITASTGVPEALTAANVRTIANVADGATANAKITAATLDTGTDDTGFVTALSISSSHNVPHVVPSTAGKVMTSDGTDWISSTPTDWTSASKAITVETPTATESISMFFTAEAVTITKMVAVLTGSATPSVTWTIRHDPDRSATGNEVVTSGTTTTSVSTGSVVTSFNDATIPANSFVWLKTTAMSGTVTSLGITLIYDKD